MLGAIHRSGPTTAYAVRAEFTGSPTSYYSASAGAIYPVVQRLGQRGLIRSRARKGDGRSSRLLEVTAAGRRALREWVGPPLEAWMTAATLDPIRTRVLFSDVLTDAECRRLLAETRDSLESEVVELEARRRAERRAGDRPMLWATTGALATARARIRWVVWVMRQLDRNPGRRRAVHASPDKGGARQPGRRINGPPT